MSQEKFFEKNSYVRPIVELVNELNEESDRGAVLVSAALLDEQLKDLIKERLVEDTDRSLFSGFNSPLGTFSARIKAAYALGIISKEEALECDHIRDIRNTFAHVLIISDAKWQSITDKCCKLEYSQRPKDMAREEPIASFKSSAIAMVIRFLDRKEFVSNNRIEAASWSD